MCLLFYFFIAPWSIEKKKQRTINKYIVYTLMYTSNFTLQSDTSIDTRFQGQTQVILRIHLVCVGKYEI